MQIFIDIFIEGLAEDTVFWEGMKTDAVSLD